VTLECVKVNSIQHTVRTRIVYRHS